LKYREISTKKYLNMAGLGKVFKNKFSLEEAKKIICLVSNEKDREKLGDLIDKFDLHVTASSSDFDKLLKTFNVALVLLCSQDERSQVCKRLTDIRKIHPCAFIVIADKIICNDADSRMEVAHSGANMVTELENNELQKAINMVAQLGEERGPFECPYCHVKGLTQHDLWIHCPLYHINVSNDTKLRSSKCPVCSKNVVRSPMMVRC